MESQSLFAILGLAFGFGLLHALDADHIMAVSGLASTRPGLRNSLLFCSRWAIGHGAALLIIGGAVLFLGMAIPVELSEFAESLVGLVLVLIGLWVFYDLHRKRAHLHFHQHDTLPRHAHFHVHHDTRQTLHPRNAHKHEPHAHNHKAIMVGLLHGTAGSAPLLALVPLAQMGSAWYGFAYLLVFGIGVLCSMLVFGGLLGGLFTWLSRWGDSVVRGLRILVASSSIIFGGYLLAGSL